MFVLEPVVENNELKDDNEQVEEFSEQIGKAQVEAALETSLASFIDFALDVAAWFVEVLEVEARLNVMAHVQQARLVVVRFQRLNVVF